MTRERVNEVTFTTWRPRANVTARGARPAPSVCLFCDAMRRDVVGVLLAAALAVSATASGDHHHYTDNSHRVALLAQLLCSKAPPDTVLDQGSWCLEKDEGNSGVLGYNIAPMHLLDQPLAEQMYQHMVASAGAGNISVFDVGAGSGQYKYWFTNRSSVGLDYRACDGALNVETFTKGVVAWCDLTRPIHAAPSDWVISLEVGEHLPEHLAAEYLANLHRLDTNGVFLSWAVPMQPGKGHINCQNNSWVTAQMEAMGYTLNATAMQLGRAVAEYPWFKNTYMVFDRLDR